MEPTFRLMMCITNYPNANLKKKKNYGFYSQYPLLYWLLALVSSSLHILKTQQESERGASSDRFREPISSLILIFRFVATVLVDWWRNPCWNQCLQEAIPSYLPLLQIEEYPHQPLISFNFSWESTPSLLVVTEAAAEEEISFRYRMNCWWTSARWTHSRHQALVASTATRERPPSASSTAPPVSLLR